MILDGIILYKDQVLLQSLIKNFVQIWGTHVMTHTSGTTETIICAPEV